MNEHGPSGARSGRPGCSIRRRSHRQADGIPRSRLSADTSIFIDLGIEQRTRRDEGRRSPARRVRCGAWPSSDRDSTSPTSWTATTSIPSRRFSPLPSSTRCCDSISATQSRLKVTAFDLSPRVLQHLEAARARARRHSVFCGATTEHRAALESGTRRLLAAVWQLDWRTRHDGPPSPAARGGRGARLLVRPPVVQPVTPVRPEHRHRAVRAP